MLHTILKRRLNEDQLANLFVNMLLESVDNSYDEIVSLIKDDNARQIKGVLNKMIGDLARMEVMREVPTKEFMQNLVASLSRLKEQGKAKGAGTAVGWTRAGQLARGETLSLSTVKRMYSFFSRHAVDKKATGFNSGEEGCPRKDSPDAV